MTTRNIQEIVEQQKLKNKKVVFPMSLFFCFQASTFDRHMMQEYIHKYPKLFRDTFWHDFTYIIPISLAIAHDTRSLLAFPICSLLITYYFYKAHCLDINTTSPYIDSQFYNLSKAKAVNRQQMLRVLSWKYAADSDVMRMNSLDDLERMLDQELQLLTTQC